MSITEVFGLQQSILVPTTDPLEEFLVWSSIAFAFFMFHSKFLQSVVDYQFALSTEALDAAYTLVVGDSNEASVTVRPLELCGASKKDFVTQYTHLINSKSESSSKTRTSQGEKPSFYPQEPSQVACLV